MARPRKKKPTVDHLLIKEEPKTEFQKAVAHLEENYKFYIGCAVFLLLCVAIGALIRVSAAIRERERATMYAEAALIENAADRLDKYRGIVDSVGRWRPEALYRMGETAVEAEKYDEAEEAFQKLTTEYPNSEYIPNAIDGLAFIAWNRGDLEAALAGFQRVTETWPGEFIARRKHYDIGRVLEEMERFEEAKSAYQQQLVVFPDSAIERRAQQALDALREDHPDLFPEEEEDALDELMLDESEEVEAPEEAVAVTEDAIDADEPEEAAVVENVAEEIAAEEPAEEAAEEPTTEEQETEPVEEEAVVEDVAEEIAAEEPVEEAVEEPIAEEQDAESVVDETLADEIAADVEDDVAESIDTEAAIEDTPSDDAGE